jgi:hypothetical protein
MTSPPATSDLAAMKTFQYKSRPRLFRSFEPTSENSAMKARIGFVLALILGWSRAASTGLAADPPPALSGGGVSDLDLQGQLEKGLKARRPVEFAYIAQIITLVEDGDLPRELVDSTFVWARKKRTKRLQYFQFALQARAAKLGYNTPDLSNQGVGLGN